MENKEKSTLEVTNNQEETVENSTHSPEETHPMFEKELKGKDGEFKKVKDIIDVDKHVWYIGDKAILKNSGIKHLKKFMGAIDFKYEKVDIPRQENEGNYAFMCFVKFPSGEESFDIGEANTLNTTTVDYNGNPDKSNVSYKHKATMALKRGFDRAFLNSHEVGLFDVYSEIEAEEFKKERQTIKRLEAELESALRRLSNAKTTYRKQLEEIEVLKARVAELEGLHNEEFISNEQQAEEINAETNTEVEQIEEEKTISNNDSQNLEQQEFPDRELLFLPEHDMKYPGQHIVDVVLKEEKDYDYLFNKIPDIYPENQDYITAITMIKQVYDAKIEKEKEKQEQITAEEFLDSIDENEEQQENTETNSKISDLDNEIKELNELNETETIQEDTEVKKETENSEETPKKKRGRPKKSSEENK